MYERVSNSKIKMMYTLYQSGKTCREVAQILGTSKNTVEKYIAKKGLTRKRVLRKKTVDGNPVKCSEVGYMCKFRAVNCSHRCDYMYITGKMRGCDAEYCFKFYEELKEKSDY